MAVGVSKFSFTAADNTGRRVTGSRSAASEEALRRSLLGEGLTPLSIVPASPLALARFIPGRNRIRHVTLAAFARQLNQYLRSGIPATEALDEMSKTAPTPVLGAALEDISARVMAGTTMSEAFAVHQKLFGEVFVAYIRSAEQTGTLEETTQRLANLLRRRAQIEQAIRGATAYPKFAGGLIGLLVFGMMWFLVPRFEELYESFDSELPAATQTLVNLSSQLPLVALAILAFVAFVMGVHARTRDNLDFGEKLDKLRFRLPMFGRLSHRLVLFRWASTFAGALDSGTHIDDAIDLAGRASGSRWMKKTTEPLKNAVMAGEQIAVTLERWPRLFPPMLRTMVHAGEKAGDLSRMLHESANVMDEETSAEVESLNGKLNTLTIALLGGVAASIIIALYLPIINLTDTAARGLGF